MGLGVICFWRGVGEYCKNGCFGIAGERGWTLAEREYRHSALTGRVIGCAMRVHSALGRSYQEAIYQRALEIEMADEGLAFEREREIPIFYKGHNIGSRRVDFLVEEKIPVELKALGKLEAGHFVQTLNYLVAFKLEVGLLINFGAGSLEFRRVENSELVERR